MSPPSLTKQSALLLAGRVLSMPLAFLVPVVITRSFTLEEFGYYKQVFLVFNIILPFVDLGITNSLYYFIPRYPDLKNVFVGQAIILSLFICTIVLLTFLFFPGILSRLFTNSDSISEYMLLLSVFAVLWHISNILEVILVVEKKAFAAGVVTFLSESARSISSIIIVIIGKGLVALLIGLVLVGLCRCILMSYYLIRKYEIVWKIDREIIKKQLHYAIPFGAAVVISGLVGNAHQYITSITSDSKEFAIFAIGCFQVPLLGVVVDSIARTSLVRMSELRNCKNSSEEIVKVVSESCRKLWLIFFPVFVYLFLAAEEFIVVLFTNEYIDSVSIFRVFVFIIPISAILVQHVLRAFAQTRFILANNILCLILTVLFCLLGKRLMGLTGIALGAVIAQAVWRYVFWWRCSSVLKVKMQALIPVAEIIKATMSVTFLGICFYVPKIVFDINSFFTLLYLFPFFFVCFYTYWKFNFLSEAEKSALVDIYNKLLHKFHI